MYQKAIAPGSIGIVTPIDGIGIVINGQTIVAPDQIILLGANITQEMIEALQLPSGLQPTSPIEYDTTEELTVPQSGVLVVPQSWGRISIIDDGTGWPVAYAISEDNPSITINGVTYTVYDTTFGIGTYTITFQ